MYKVNFAGNDLEKVVIIEKIKRSILPTRENFSKNIPTIHGSVYTGYKYSERVIELEIGIVAKSKEEFVEKTRILAEMLDVTSPSRLVLGDEPDKYYYAVPNGDSDIEKLFKSGGRATLQFICHDPIAYSKDWKCFTPDAKRHIKITNNGTAETSPVIDVDFMNNSCFFQITNAKGETVLIGQPKDATKPVVPLTDVVVNDDCSSSSTFTSIAESLLDSNRRITGQHGVGYNGNGMTCTNYGSGDDEGVWIGAGFKRNLNANLDEFEVEIDLVFTSEGRNYYVPPTPTAPPNPTVPNTPTTSSYGTYEVYGCGGLWINETADTSKPLYAMAPGTKIYPTEIKGNWAKHTHKNQWNTFTGWSSMKYLRKISDSVVRSVSEPIPLEEFAEDEVGLLEVYGFDQNGAKLFKMEVSDTNQYYEYVEPKVYIGNNLVLDDGKKCPDARKIDVKDNDGKVTGQREVESGVFGDWNDLIGKIVIRREKNSKGQYLWSATVYSYRNGSIVNTMSTQNSLNNSSYPSGSLNYLGFYIGKLGKIREVDLIAIDNIKVRRLNMKTDEVIDSSLEIFKAKDHLQIDFRNGLVKLNDQVFLTSIDIGSEFFDIKSGVSSIAIRSDDTDARVICGIQECYI